MFYRRIGSFNLKLRINSIQIAKNLRKIKCWVFVVYFWNFSTLCSTDFYYKYIYFKFVELSVLPLKGLKMKSPLNLHGLVLTSDTRIQTIAARSMKKSSFRKKFTSRVHVLALSFNQPTTPTPSTTVANPRWRLVMTGAASTLLANRTGGWKFAELSCF